MERTAHALVNRRLGASVQEMITRVVHRVAAILHPRPEMITNELRHGADESPDRDGLAQTVAREVTAVLSDLWECAERLEGSPPTLLEINQTVRQAIETARESWEKRPRWQKGSLELTFEPSAEPLVSEISTALVGVLAYAIENAIEAMPRGGRIHVRTAREHGYVLISVGEAPWAVMGGEFPEERTPPVYSSHWNRPLRLGFAIVRAFATRHGGDATLSKNSAGGTTLVLRIPATQDECRIVPYRESIPEGPDG